MADLDDVVARLDQLNALLSIGFGQQIASLREELNSNSVYAAIIATLGDEWVTSGDIQRTVSKSAKVSERTVLRALTDLVDRRVILVRGSGRLTSFKSSGLL